MKHIIYITFGLLIAVSGYSQNKQTSKADAFYESYRYVDAIEAYEALVKDKKADAYVYRQLANSYYHIFNTEKAAQYYAKAIEKPQDAETYYNYAQTLKAQGNYTEANRQLDMFAKLKPNDQRAKAYKAATDYLTDLKSIRKTFDVSETTINHSGSSDFGAVLGNDNSVYFASTRNTSNKTDQWSGQPYLDLYRSDYTTDGTLSEPEVVKELNTRFHDGPATLSTDGNVMFFSRDGLSEGSYEKNRNANMKIGKVGIYRAEKRDGKWTNIKPMPFNSTKYSVGNPSLSKDGKTLYFASDMPGGLGDTDIWKVEIKANNSYGKPENLGSTVNTEGKESFPFIADDGTLYFASTGKPGFGGYDVFKADLKTGIEARNLGKPVNSEKDDFALTFNSGKGIGFLSSNRAGTDNIYLVHPICGREVVVVVKDAETGKLLSGATVTTEGIHSVTASNGTATFCAECEKDYRITAQLQNYQDATAILKGSSEPSARIEIVLTPIAAEAPVITDTEVQLQSILFEFDKSNITAQGAFELDKLVKVMQEHPAMVIYVKSHTDTKGSVSYNQKLSEQRAQSTVQYVISKGIAKERITGKGFGKSESKIDCKTCTDEQDAQNRRSEFKIVN